MAETLNRFDTILAILCVSCCNSLSDESLSKRSDIARVSSSSDDSDSELEDTSSSGKQPTLRIEIAEHWLGLGLEKNWQCYHLQVPR